MRSINLWLWSLPDAEKRQVKAQLKRMLIFLPCVGCDRLVKVRRYECFSARPMCRSCVEQLKGQNG